MPGFPVKITGTQKAQKAPFILQGRPALHLNLDGKRGVRARVII